MSYLRNAWYLAAWDYEISREMLTRVIMEERILLYRKEDGGVVAISNVCPHRFAPLDQGKLKGDLVECPYHGLQFNEKGRCVYNPNPHGDGPIPSGMEVKAYPVHEKYGAAWVWMGDLKPDIDLIPDYHWIDDVEGHRTVRGVIEMDCNYRSVADNLLDLTHLHYVHHAGLGAKVENAYEEKLEHLVKGHEVWCNRSAESVEASKDFQMLNKKIENVPVDKRHNVRWIPPSNSLVSINYWKAGTDYEDKTGSEIGHMATPIDLHRTTLFWSISRNFLLDSKDTDEMINRFAHIAIDDQDKVIMEEQQRMMGDCWDLDELGPVCLPNDESVNRARMILKKLIRDEESRQLV